jgi:hypothetical protein
MVRIGWVTTLAVLGAIPALAQPTATLTPKDIADVMSSVMRFASGRSRPRLWRGGGRMTSEVLK